ncbi:hypothetical protein [Sphingosinicella sp. BN140058]|uniref:hypothetical protein n=1 Tax=Sphingosinicella sp. BN140058 TaxID=1892855 RepID=UPI0010113BA7|nr:hypothetical protein [Sphingosinicella sp. BN140058]QAY77620.1 hypothetical protein ETR14_14705 [Sphingosinicella sp. BN140058]
MADTTFDTPGGGSPAPSAPGAADSERGRPATFDPKSGEVHGSGSGAGGGGNQAEDYDGDPMAGASQEPVGRARPIDKAIDRPIDPDEGI